MENYLKLSNRYLLEYSVNGNEGVIKYSDLKKYYEYATKDDCEYINANICDDKIVICFTVAQGQGGVVAVWDTVTKHFTHVSNGEYSVTATLSNNKIYIISNVHNFMTSDYYELTYISYGTINSLEDGVTVCELDKTLIKDPDYISKIEIKDKQLFINDCIYCDVVISD